MTTRICARCGGHGEICANCGVNHKSTHAQFRACRARRTVACPGVPKGYTTRMGDEVKAGPHFETFTECDVCRVRKPGRFFAPTGYTTNSHGWEHLKRSSDLAEPSLQVCPDCVRAHEKIRTMTLEYLMAEREGLRMGEVLDLKTGLVAQPGLPFGTPPASAPRP